MLLIFTLTREIERMRAAKYSDILQMRKFLVQYNMYPIFNYRKHFYRARLIVELRSFNCFPHTFLFEWNVKFLVFNNELFWWRSWEKNLNLQKKAQRTTTLHDIFLPSIHFFGEHFIVWLLCSNFLCVKKNLKENKIYISLPWVLMCREKIAKRVKTFVHQVDGEFYKFISNLSRDESFFIYLIQSQLFWWCRSRFQCSSQGWFISLQFH